MRVGKEGADPSGAPEQKVAADVWSPENVCEEGQPVSKETPWDTPVAQWLLITQGVVM